MGKNKKKHKVKFTEKKQSVQGILSAVVGIITVLILAFVLYKTTTSGGTSGLLIGVAGFLVLACSIVGMVLSARSFKQKDIYYVWPIVGLVTNGGVFLGMVILYFLGLSM